MTSKITAFGIASLVSGIFVLLLDYAINFSVLLPILYGLIATGLGTTTLCLKARSYYNAHH